MRDEQYEEAKALEMIGVQTRNATHDLNNQMAAIMTFAELVLEELAADHPLRRDIEEIRAAGQRAVVKTRELEQLARRLSPIVRRAA